jgi:hypothetical protein
MRQLLTPRPFARAVLSLLLLALPGLGVAAGPPTPPGGTLDTFVSGGKRVTVERYQPARPGKYPVVVLLHGLEGPKLSASVFRPAARRLAKKGFVVLLVRYFERTGTRPKEALALGKQLQDHLRNPRAGRCPRVLREHFVAWRGAVRDAVKYARALPGVDPDRRWRKPQGQECAALPAWSGSAGALSRPRAAREGAGALPGAPHACRS